MRRAVFSVVVDSLCDIVDGPFQTSNEIVISVGTAWLNSPRVAAHLFQFKVCFDCLSGKGSRKILLIGKDQDSRAV